MRVFVEGVVGLNISQFFLGFAQMLIGLQVKNDSGPFALGVGKVLLFFDRQRFHGGNIYPIPSFLQRVCTIPVTGHFKPAGRDRIKTSHFEMLDLISGPRCKQGDWRRIGGQGFEILGSGFMKETLGSPCRAHGSRRRP